MMCVELWKLKTSVTLAENLSAIHKKATFISKGLFNSNDDRFETK